MLPPHLTLPGAGSDSESRLGWHGPPPRACPPAHRGAVRRPPYRQPCWPLSQGPAPAFASASGAAVGTRRPPAELGASETPRAGLAGRAPAVQRLAANGAGSRPIGGAAYDKAAGGAAPPAARGRRPMAARRGAHPPLPTVSAPVGPAVTAAAVGARGLQLGRCSGRGRRSHPDLHRFETSGERRCGRGVAMLLRNESPGAVILLSREESRAGLLLLSLGSWKASNLVPFRTWGTAVGLLLAFLLGHSGLQRTPCLLADRLSPSLDCLCLEERWWEGGGGAVQTTYAT